MNGTEPKTGTEQPIENPAELRRQTVDAVARAKQLEEQRRAAVELADRLEELAVQALTEDRKRVPIILDQRVEALKQAESLAEQLRTAAVRANHLKSELLEEGQASA